MKSEESRHSLWTVPAILVLGFCLRLGMIIVERDALDIDRDLYLGIAQQLVSEGKFAHPETGLSTAYRPPFYPLLLAACLQVFNVSLSVALPNLALGTSTIWLTYRLARLLDVDHSLAAIAATLVAVDPLLVRYSSQAMTEVCYTYLVSLMVLSIVKLRQSSSWKLQLSVGGMIGLCGLCRPTTWAFVGLACGVESLRMMITNRGLRPSAKLRQLPWI